MLLAPLERQIPLDLVVKRNWQIHLPHISIKIGRNPKSSALLQARPRKPFLSSVTVQTRRLGSHAFIIAQVNLIGKDFVPIICIGHPYNLSPNQMEIHQLRYFVAVAEERSFSRAAEKVRVAQPSLSQQIQKLEAELGHSLFDRLTRKVVLTEAGHDLLPFAHRILNELSSAQRHIADRGRRPGGIVKIGILPTIAPYILEKLVHECRSHHPGVELQILEDVTDSLTRKVDSGEIDLAIISTCRPSSGIHLESLGEESLALALPAGHRLARHGNVSWKALRQETVLLLHESNCLSRQIQKWCAENRVGHRRLGILQLSTLLTLVGSGLGISLIPRMAVPACHAPGCVFLRFNGAEPKREINLLRNTLHYQSKAAIAVADICRKLFVELSPND